MSTSYLFSHDGLHDSLTNLYAPSFMYDLMERRLKIAERNKTPLSLIRVLCERQGDESTIVNVAEVLTSQLRADDIIGRMGFYEFLVVLAPSDVGVNSERYHATICSRCQSVSNVQLIFSTVQSQAQERLRTLLDRLDAATPIAL